MSKTELTTAIESATSKEIATRSSNVGKGSENVTALDMAIPRLKLLQMISDEVTPGHAKQVEGATAGMLMNSVSNELYNAAFVVNLHFSKKTVVWKKRSAGGGMMGSFGSEEEALIAIKERGLREEDHDISENPTHLVMLLDETGASKGVALLDMPGTKIKVSKKWNSLINEQEAVGNPRFGCVWKLAVSSESNNSGNYFNYDVSFLLHAPKEVYASAETAFESFFGTPVSDANVA
jgi:hypothetical protein